VGEEIEGFMTAGTECVIRAAAPADVGAIASLAAELARHVRDPDPQWSAEYLEAQLFSAEPWAQCLVAEVRGLVAGYLTYCKQVEIHAGRRWLWIGDLYVTAQTRRTGIARHLIADLQSRARALGCAGLRLDLFRPNVEASGFYAKLGARMEEDLALILLSVRS
jgi:GNAT superfamily N-acetyltransferase